MVDVKAAMTRKFGPLPVWGWAVAIGGSVILFRVVTGKGAFPKGDGASGGGGGNVTAAPIIPGSENSGIGNLSASDLAGLRELLTPASTPGATGPDAGKPVWPWNGWTPPNFINPVEIPTTVPVLPGLPPPTTNGSGHGFAPPDSGPAAPRVGATGVTGPDGAPAGGANVYFAKAGDTLDAIAARFNIPGGGNALWALNPNNVSGRYNVHAGQGITLWT